MVKAVLEFWPDLLPRSFTTPPQPMKKAGRFKFKPWSEEQTALQFITLPSPYACTTTLVNKFTELSPPISVFRSDYASLFKLPHSSGSHSNDSYGWEKERI